MHLSRSLHAHLSSQYIVLMRYSCWMLSTGQRSVVISSSVRFCLFPMTRNWTACGRESGSGSLGGREGTGRPVGVRERGAGGGKESMRRTTLKHSGEHLGDRNVSAQGGTMIGGVQHHMVSPLSHLSDVPQVVPAVADELDPGRRDPLLHLSGDESHVSARFQDWIKRM